MSVLLIVDTLVSVVLAVVVWDLWHRMSAIEKRAATNALLSNVRDRVNAVEADVRSLLNGRT